MKEIGELLRQGREEKGISLEDISNATKISIGLLRALEEGDFSRFAGMVYLKGALRNYAEAIGIDSRELFALYDRIIEKNNNFTIAGKEKEQGKKNEDTKRTNKVFVQKVKKPFPVIALIWLSVLFVVIGGSIWYRYQQVTKNKGLTTYPGEFLPVVEEKKLEEIAANNSPKGYEQDPEKPEEPTLIFLEGNSREGIYVLKGVEKKEILLRFKADCWISVEQDGVLIGQKTYRRDEIYRINNAQETRIRFGNPPAVQVFVNGQEIDITAFANPYNLTVRLE